MTLPASTTVGRGREGWTEEDGGGRRDEDGEMRTEGASLLASIAAFPVNN